MPKRRKDARDKTKVKSKPNERAEANILAWLVCAFACGILLQLACGDKLVLLTGWLVNYTKASSPFANPLLGLMVLASLLAVSLMLLLARKSLRVSPAVYLCCLCLLLGFARMEMRAQNFGASMLLENIEEVVLEGRVRQVSGAASGGKRGVRVLLDKVEFVSELASDSAPQVTPQSVSLRYWGGAAPRLHARIRITARLLAPSRALLPSGFDFRRYARFKGIDAYGSATDAYEYAPDREDNAKEESIDGRSLPRFFETGFFLTRLRANIGERIDKSMGSEAAIARALLIGDREGITRAELDRIRVAGLAHILAISGLHLGLFAFGIFALVRRISTLSPHACQRLPIKKIAATIALIAAFCYMLLANASVPTQRAFIMSGLVLCAVLCDRSAISLRVVALAALLVLVIRPESITHAGFHMSFAAAASLVAVYDLFARRRRDRMGGRTFKQNTTLDAPLDLIVNFITNLGAIFSTIFRICAGITTSAAAVVLAAASSRESAKLTPSKPMSFMPMRIPIIAPIARVFRMLVSTISSPMTLTAIRVLVRAIAMLIATTIIASLATAPFVIYHFGRIAQYGLLSNLLVIPLLGLVVLPLGALGLLLMPLSLEGFALKAMGWGIAGIRIVADKVAALPNAALLVEQPPTSFLFLFASGLFFVIFFMRHKIFSYLGCGLCACAFFIAYTQPSPLALLGGESQSLWLRDYAGEYWRFGGWQGAFEYHEWTRYVANAKKISTYRKSRGEKEMFIDSGEGLVSCNSNSRGSYSCRMVAREGVLQIVAHEPSKSMRVSFVCDRDNKDLYRKNWNWLPSKRPPPPNPHRVLMNACRSFSYDEQQLADAHALVIYPSSLGLRALGARR